MVDRVGQQLGNYRLLRALGQGAFATVYLGEHLYLERLAAIKVLHVQMEPGTHESFRREARTIAQLRHPHIIDVHDFGFEDQTPYLVMEYTEGGTLRSLYPRGTCLPFEQIATYVMQIASALDYAHEQHIIHRDVKPENILLDTKHQIVLSDFGIAVVQRTLDTSSTQNSAGTCIYMAPEQIKRKACAASDQYALGVMVYEWLCGEPPFHGPLFEVLSQHLHKPPPSLLARLSQLPPAVENTVFRALAKDPRQRFDNVTDFARALSDAFFATRPPLQNTSVKHKAQEGYKQPLTRVKLVPVPLPSEQDLTDNTTQPLEGPVPSFAPHSVIDYKLVSQQHPPVYQQATLALQNQNRVRMLRRLRRSYTDLMSQSLQGTTWLELGLADKPDAVQNAANLLLRRANRTEKILPPGTSITQAYDEAEHELLILGEPGAGKSTLLLDLALHLVARAEQDPTHSLPVILPLSSWAIKCPDLQDWITEQLAEIYDVPSQLSMQWVQENEILPLLDGLDEMEETARLSCIMAINTYHRAHLMPLVICSRRAEYEDAASRQKLALQYAVLIQPLTLEQVQASLNRITKPLDALRHTLKTNTALQELTTTPLMLNILMLTYSGTPMQTLPHETPALQRQVWSDYVARVIEQKGDTEHYPLQQTCSWLSWLARNLQKHHQTVFYLEHIQSDWLPTKLWQSALWLTVLLPAILLGMLSSLLIGMLQQTVFDLTTGIQAIILGGLLGSCFSQTTGTITDRDRSTTQVRSGKRHLRITLISVGIGLLFFLSFGFELGSLYKFDDWLRDGCIYGSIIGLSCWLLLTLLPMFTSQHSSIRSPQATQGLHQLLSIIHVKRTLLGTAVLVLGYGLSTGLSYRLSYGPSSGLSVGLAYGCTTFVISLIIEKNREGITLTEQLRWTWSSFFHGLRSFKHCITSVALGTAVLLTYELSYWLSIGTNDSPGTSLGFRLSYGLSNGLSSGLSGGLSGGLSYGLIMGADAAISYWLVLGLFQSIVQKQIEDRDRQIFNQGVRRSVLNSTIIGFLSAGIIGCAGVLSYGLTYGLNQGLSKGLGYGMSVVLSIGLVRMLSTIWLFAISGGLLGWAVSGGWAVLRHFVLRRLLHRSNTFPWRTQAFLDDAKARILLRRVGGGYSFIHRLLLEYFANLD